MFQDERLVYALGTKALLDAGYQRQLAMYMARKQERENNNSPLKRREPSQLKESISVEKISEKISEYLNRSSVSELLGMKVSL
jgi:hypothetical protein